MSELQITDSLISTLPVPAITVAYAKDHIRALGSIDDNLIAVWINAAASYFEEQTGRQLITATREVWLDAFPWVGATGAASRIELPHPPLQSIVSVRYLDANGVLQSFTGGSPVSSLFTSSAPAGPYARRGWVEPLFGQPWPTPYTQTGAIRIRYTCGYGDTPDDIPELVRGILCFLIGHFDTNRAAVQNMQRGESVMELPYGVKEMIGGFKYSALPSQVLRTVSTVTTWP
jgi:uncharacterized phiE125 gp8 family phage protein